MDHRLVLLRQTYRQARILVVAESESCTLQGSICPCVSEILCGDRAHDEHDRERWIYVAKRSSVSTG